jgi:hypothetical protein
MTDNGISFGISNIPCGQEEVLYFGASKVCGVHSGAPRTLIREDVGVRMGQRTRLVCTSLRFQKPPLKSQTAPDSEHPSFDDREE